MKTKCDKYFQADYTPQLRRFIVSVHRTASWGALGCEQIRMTGDMLGGLRPIYPMRVCLADEFGGPPPPVNEYLYREGCLMAQFVRYVVVKMGRPS